MRRGLRNLVYAVIGIALGGIGIGWHGQPSDAEIVAALRARSPQHARAQITLVDVQRDWLHEIYGLWDSLFFVIATITPPDGAAADTCFVIEPGAAGANLALGPYAMWRCKYRL